MRFSLVLHVIGLIVRVFGLMFLAPVAVAIIYGEYRDAIGFVLTALATSLTGQLMVGAGGVAADEAMERMRRAEGLAAVSMAWLLSWMRTTA